MLLLVFLPVLSLMLLPLISRNLYTQACFVRSLEGGKLFSTLTG